MKVKCPSCGHEGVDRFSLPLEREDEGGFEVRGRYRGKAVRKCLNCGAGIFVKSLPPRYKAIPPSMWAEMQRQWEEMQAPGGYLSEERIRADIERANQMFPPPDN
jgi:DNA-directed RNA polymerase subunit RPC12/RpoP